MTSNIAIAALVVVAGIVTITLGKKLLRSETAHPLLSFVLLVAILLFGGHLVDMIVGG